MSELEDNFEIDWLSERYPFDAEARSKSLETNVLTDLPQNEKTTFVDVGAGTGSNSLYFLDKIPQDQKWYLVELNEDLKKTTIRRFKDYASYHKYDFVRQEDKLKINTPRKEVEVIIINGSLLRLKELVDLHKIDLVLANAVFDLFSEEQITAFVKMIDHNQLPLYATLNYESMAFIPADPFDDVFINYYNSHMERPQSFGNALGNKAVQFMTDLLHQRKNIIDSDVSTWRIETDDIKMHYYLLNFMENALEEMNLEASMQANFQKWLQRKKDLIITRQQRLEIKHLGYLR